MRYILLILIFLTVELNVVSVFSQANCYASLKNDTLTLGNDLIERKYIWNNGNLITYSLTDKSNNQHWQNLLKNPDFSITKNKEESKNASFKVTQKKSNSIQPTYLEATVTFTIANLNVKRVFIIFDHCPAIASDNYLKGIAENIQDDKLVNVANLKNIEFAEDMNYNHSSAVLDQIKLDGKHWHIQTVEFFDVTDWNNNLVAVRDFISYRKTSYKGNLLFAKNEENEKGIFFLKESPTSSTQIAYNGGDFTSEFGQIQVVGSGISGTDLKVDEWVKAYSTVIGVCGGGELDRLSALRTYQKNIRTLLPRRDEMIMMNTWGDRSQDSKINEKFSLLELEKASELGITHFQIDDGWQTGKSPNSATAKGSFLNIWDNPNYWKPDSVKYPRGLMPIVSKGKELGVEICLWFNPSIQNDYADWVKDAQALIDLYNKYGIRTYKIDGLSIPNKNSESNLRRFFDKVLENTNNNVVFNLDATAGKRGGYHMLNQYGNIFLENRYTDWQNYYPYWSLRNLWQLSKYVPAEKIQLEFLNKWRNSDKYKNDKFAPANYSFEYLFAITMAAQPLAWLEGSGLPDEAFTLKNLISKYKAVQHDFHNGIILPIGDEPSGKSWTGFQSIAENNGYLILFRENNLEKKAFVKTWLKEGTKVKCIPILGNGKELTITVGRQGFIEVMLPNMNDFVMYKYDLLN